MPSIRYVCLSDTHLGAKNGILTSDGGPSAVLVELIGCLKRLIQGNPGGQRPVLVLNGDILELALSDTNVAAASFLDFFRQVLPEQPGGEPLFERILFIPGNHDHHLWETARETQYMEYLARYVGQGQELPPPRHATTMFVQGPHLTTRPDGKPHHPTILVPAHFLLMLVRRLGYPCSDDYITTFYPNHGLLCDGHKRCVIFSHGHFIEKAYHLMSTLRRMVYPDRPRPELVWQVEKENFAWIDFLWSALGRSGGVGEDVGLIYEDLQYPDKRQRLFANFGRNLADIWPWPKVLRKLEPIIGEWAVRQVGSQIRLLERRKAESPLSVEGYHGLHSYVEGPVYRQVLWELGGRFPDQLTFAFGHTHKPFADQRRFHFHGEAAVGVRRVDVYNTGGWVVEHDVPAREHGGAVLLLDEDLNAAFLQVYKESARKTPYGVTVSAAGAANAFATQVGNLIEADRDSWLRLGEVIRQRVLELCGNGESVS